MEDRQTAAGKVYVNVPRRWNIGPREIEFKLPTGEQEPPKSEIVKSALRVEDGFLIVPDAPGIGVELADDAQEKHPPRPREVRTRLHVDGSVIDQ